jgi:hypothetical protein
MGYDRRLIDVRHGGSMSRSQQHFSEKETEARREAALKRMLQTPHKPHKPISKKKASPKSLARNEKAKP